MKVILLNKMEFTAQFAVATLLTKTKRLTVDVRQAV